MTENKISEILQILRVHFVGRIAKHASNRWSNCKLELLKFAKLELPGEQLDEKEENLPEAGANAKRYREQSAAAGVQRSPPRNSATRRFG